MRILVISAIDPVAIDVLSSRHDVVQAYDPQPHELLRLVVDADVLVFRSGVTISAEVLDAAPALSLLVRAGAGTDNVDIAAVRARGIRLETIPAPGAKAVAEMAFALMLPLARNVIVADQLTRQGRWAKHQLTGQALHGRTLGIVGAGNIGSRVGRLGALWGMTVLGCVEHPSGDVAEALAWCGIRLTDLPEVLRSSDYVSVHVPLKESTRYLIDAAALARMKRGAFLINLARGGVVDEVALREALTTKHVAGAALDVHEREGAGQISPLADLPNVILTPHIGAGSVDAQHEIGVRLVQIVEAHATALRAEIPTELSR